MSLALLLLLIALSTLSAFADDVTIINIDCGSSSDYKDGVGREWVGDGGYTKSGKPMTVTNSLSNERMMNTLRVFSTGKKNCYSVPSASHIQVIVRASFYYGNYDKKSSPPTFDLVLDGTPWGTVVTSKNKTVSHEAIYVVKGSHINVCVLATAPNNIPFISALEVRSINYDMYKHYDPNTALFLTDRSFFSDTPSSILDSSGRIWESIDAPSDMSLETSEATSIDGSSIDDNPPEEVLRNAVTVPKASDRIHVTTTNLPASSVPVYVTMYFSEVAVLDPTTQQRLFDIYVEDQLLTTDPVAPPYGTVDQYSIYDITANSSTSFYLAATSASTLPPILNAFEVFMVSANMNNKKKSKLPVILGTIIPAFVLFWVVVGFLAIRAQKRKSAALAAMTNMGGQGGGPNGTPIHAHGQSKDFAVQMAVNYSGEEALMNNKLSGNDHSTTIHDNNAHDKA